MASELSVIRREGELVRSRVIKCGFGGSGNYLTYKVIRLLQEAAGCHYSVARASGLSEVLRAIRPNPKFPEEPEVDTVYFDRLETCTPVARLMPHDRGLMDQHSSLIWTLDPPDDVIRRFPQRTHRVYVLRDARDAVASMVHKKCSADAREICPDYEVTTPEGMLDLISPDGEPWVERTARRWKEHVRSYMETAAHWYTVRYEDLVGPDKRGVVSRLATFLGLYDSSVVADIVAVTDPDAMREKAPLHVRRAKPGGAQELGIVERVEAVCGDELALLGY